MENKSKDLNRGKNGSGSDSHRTNSSQGESRKESSSVNRGLGSADDDLQRTVSSKGKHSSQADEDERNQDLKKGTGSHSGRSNHSSSDKGSSHTDKGRSNR